MMASCYNSNHTFPCPLALRPLRFRAIVAERAGGFFITATMDKSQIKEKDIARFWAKVDKRGENDCWRWLASFRNKGYGAFSFAGKQDRAHRFSFILHGGILTPKKPCVLHKCDNPPCCNPNHLFAGSVLDNNADMVAKGRSKLIDHTFVKTCENNWNAKISNNQAFQVKVDFSKGEKAAHIARRLGVSKNLVSRIVKGKTWVTIPSVPMDLRLCENRLSRKVKADDVRNMFKMRSERISFSIIGRKFGINESTVREIIDRKIWSHVDIESTLIESAHSAKIIYSTKSNSAVNIS